MRITILTYGSRGDVQPFLALAVGLQKSGHQVKLAAPHHFENFVSQLNVPFVPFTGDPETFVLELHWPFTRDTSRILTPLVLACSSTILSHLDDWFLPHIHIPGYLFLDTAETYKPLATLTDFLSEGAPPFCITFGSMIHRDAERIYRIVLDTKEKTGNCAIVLSSWSDL